MEQYLFVPGRHPLISLAELLSVAARDGIGFHIVAFSEVIIAQCKTPFDPPTFLRGLGGTVKIARVVRTIPALAPPAIVDLLEETGVEGKLFFGISSYIRERPKRRDIRSIGLAVKTMLKERGITSRFVTSREPVLSSVVVRKNKLLTQGAELLIVPGEGGYLVGRTLAVQDVDEYTHRDVGRPVRDLRAGTLAPKLAQVLANLARTPRNGTLLDPFCGSGTILQEALLAGYTRIIGADISRKAVSDTKANLEWLERQRKGTLHCEVLQSDVRALAKHLPIGSIDAIVTEPHLGPPTVRTRTLAERTARELEKLYRAAFQTFLRLLKPGGRVAIIFPVFRFGPRERRLELLPRIATLGFRRLDLIPPELLARFSLPTHPHGSLLYARPGQHVLREIFVFEKTS